MDVVPVHAAFAKAIDAAMGLTTKYRVRLQVLCDNTQAQKKPPQRQQDGGVITQAGDLCHWIFFDLDRSGTIEPAVAIGKCRNLSQSD